MMDFRLAAFLASAIFFVALADSAGAHPVHFSFADAQWNSDAGCLEVALRMEPEDLQNALRRQAQNAIQRRITLESPSAESMVRRYVLDRLHVETKQNKTAEIRWVGYETTMKAVWVYFEIVLPDGPDGIRISNRLLLEHSDEQVNVVAVRDQERRGTVRLVRGAATRTLVLSSPEKETSQVEPAKRSDRFKS
jgi:hypothetical protein